MKRFGFPRIFATLGLGIALAAIMAAAPAQAESRRSNTSVTYAKILQEADMKARANDFAGAIAKAEEVLALDPANQLARMRIQTWRERMAGPARLLKEAEAKAQAKDYLGAIKLAGQVLAADPENEMARGLIWAWRGMIQYPGKPRPGQGRPPRFANARAKSNTADWIARAGRLQRALGGLSAEMSPETIAELTAKVAHDNPDLTPGQVKEAVERFAERRSVYNRVAAANGVTMCGTGRPMIGEDVDTIRGNHRARARGADVVLPSDSFCGTKADVELIADWRRLKEDSENVFRVRLEADIPLEEAKSLKLRVENLGFSPVYVETNGAAASVLYGDFPSRRQAEKAGMELRSRRVWTLDIVPARRAPSDVAGDALLAAKDPKQSHPEPAPRRIEQHSTPTEERKGAGSGSEVYRVVIEQDIPLNQAQAYKLKIEGMGYVPVYLDVHNDGSGDVATVQYGNFTSKREAETAKKELSRNNINTLAVIATRRESQMGGPKYTVLAKVCDTREEAFALKTKLENEGYLAVKVRWQGAKYNVTVGEYGSENTANNQLVGIRAMGLTTAKAMKIDDAGPEVAAGPDPATPPVPIPFDRAVAAEAIKRSNPNLSPEQLDKVVDLLEEKVQQQHSEVYAVNERINVLENVPPKAHPTAEEIRKSNPDLTPEQIEKIKKLLEERASSKCPTGTPCLGLENQLMMAADAKAQAKDYLGAIKLAGRVLAADPGDAAAKKRIREWRGLIQYPGKPGDFR